MKHLKRTLTVGTLGWAVAFVSTPAGAVTETVDGFHYSSNNHSDTQGNTDIGNSQILFSHETANWNSHHLPADLHSGTRLSSDQVFVDHVLLFGSEVPVMMAHSSGSVETRSKDDQVIQRDVSATFRVMNNTIGGSSVAQVEPNKMQASMQESISKTLKVDHKAMVLGIIPVKLTASIQGTLAAGATASAFGEPHIGPGSIVASTDAQLNASAGIIASFEVDVIVAGVDVDIKLVEVGVTPSLENVVIANPTTSFVMWGNRAPMHLRTMDGSVKVWAGVFETEIVSWNGWVTDTELYNESGIHPF